MDQIAEHQQFGGLIAFDQLIKSLQISRGLPCWHADAGLSQHRTLA